MTSLGDVNRMDGFPATPYICELITIAFLDEVARGRAGVGDVV